MRERIKQWEKTLGVKVVYSRYSDVENRTVLAEWRQGQMTSGWYEAGTNTAYIFLPHNSGVESIDATFVHEVVAHKGIKELLGEEKFNEFLDKVWDMMDAESRKEYLEYVGGNEETESYRRAAADEYVAHLSEGMSGKLSPAEKSVWQKIVDLFRSIFASKNKELADAIMSKETLTDKDIKQMIMRSFESLREKAKSSSEAVPQNTEGEQTAPKGTMMSKKRAGFGVKKVDARRFGMTEKQANDAIDKANSIVFGKSVAETKAEREERENERRRQAKELYDAVLSGEFNDVTLHLIDNYITDVTPENPYGKRISQRVPQAVERKVYGNKRTSAVDLLFSRISESAVPASERASKEGRRRIEEKKNELLKGWAIATGNWHTDLSAFVAEETPFDSGKDSDVYNSKEDGFVIKASKGKPVEKRFPIDLDNVPLFNFYFPNAEYEILGYGEIDGNFVRILRQPMVPFAENASVSEAERVEYMDKMGFRPLNKDNTAFTNDDFVVADLQKANIVRDINGDVRVIDADMKLHTVDMGGNYDYPPVEEDTRLRKVWHGSGASFDKFDHSHMGEGEGAQAYGWGTYVTDVEGIGRTYAKASAKGENITYDGKPLGDVLDSTYFDNIWQLWKRELLWATTKEELKSAISNVYIDARIASPRSKRGRAFNKQKKELLADIDNGRIKIISSRHLYEVEIPDDNGSNYLHWESDNSKEVLDKLNGAYKTMLIERGVDEDDIVDGFAPFGSNPKYALSGESIYNTFARELGGDKKASQFLNKQGFVGVSYPTEYRSGGRSDGARNFVIFNEEDAKIEGHTRFRKVSKQIEKLFDQAVAGDLTGKPVSIGKLTKAGKEYLEKISGLTLKDDVDFVLNPSDLVHIYNEHYGDNEKDKGNNIPLTKHDIKRMVDVVAFPTKVVYGEGKGGHKSFYFLMDSPGGAYNMLEVYADKKGNLSSKTYYKTKKGVSQRVMNISNSLHSTSVADGATLSDAKVPQMFDNPKREDVKFKKYKSKDGKETPYRQLSLFDTEAETASDRASSNSVQREGDTTLSVLNHLRELEDGEVCNVERKFTERGGFDFTRGEKVLFVEDVAYIFKNLEDEAIENSFAAFVKDGEVTVMHVGMGAQAMTVSDATAIIAGAERMNADKVFFVHNHPSGKLVCSREDINLYTSLKMALGDKLWDGIIINTRSGKYGVFNENGIVSSGEEHISPQKEYPLKIYSFNKQAFHGDVVNVEPSSAGIAKFVSTQRLGSRNKINALLLDDSFGCLGNVFLSETDITKKNTYPVMQKLVADAISMGARNIVLYGRTPFVSFTGGNLNLGSRLSEYVRGLSFGNVQLRDVIQLGEGTYTSAVDDGIRFRKANRNQVGFVSNAMKAVEGIKQEKATPEQWLKMIEKQGGLKAGEDKWLGLSDWLKSREEKTLTKQEVLDFIGENMIQIEEVRYGEGMPAHAQQRLDELNEEFGELMGEAEEETGSGYTSDWEEYAMDAMAERYGDDFRDAFEVEDGNLVPTKEYGYDELSESAKFFLDISDKTSKPIDKIRLTYTTEGLANKREIALTVPTIESWNESDGIHFGDAGDGRAVAWIRFGETLAYETVERVYEVMEFHEPYKGVNGHDIYKPVGGFRSGDYVAYGKGRNGEMIYVVYINDKQMPVAHATLEDARNAMNEYYREHPREQKKPLNVLVIDEIQSKRHQEGREQGYKDDKAVDEAREKYLEAKRNKRKWELHLDEKYNGKFAEDFGLRDVSKDDADTFRSLDIKESEAYKEFKLKESGIPYAPFEKNWHELAMKRMLRLAAEEGFDKVAWTTGEQQAERYDIGTSVKSIEVNAVTDSETGEVLDDEFDVFTRGNWNGGGFISEATGRMSTEQIMEVFGKDLGGRIVENGRSQRYSVVEGDDLRLGGEGMKGFYDRMLPSFVQKYTKKWGAKVGEVELPDLEESARKMWSVDVTPQMKESVGEQVMFRFIGKKGAENLDKAEEATIRLDNLNVAREMENAGKDAKAIKMATGWERGKDRLWRYEVEDNIKFDKDGNVDFGKRNPDYKRYKELLHKKNALAFEGKELTEEEQKEFDALAPVWKGTKLHKSHKLKDYVDAPELFAAYPELADVKLVFRDDISARGYYDKEKNEIGLNTSVPTGKIEEVLVHEIQHAIQYAEGFGEGGSLMTSQPLIKEIVELAGKGAETASLNTIAQAFEEGYIPKDRTSEAQKIAEKHGYSDLGKYIRSLQAYDYYRSLAGEVESRNVQKRMGMSVAERRASLASETEDVAREDQHILKDGLSLNYVQDMNDTNDLVEYARRDVERRNAKNLDADGVRLRKVTDPKKIAELEASEKQIGYRNVVLNEDGTFGSPMASSLRRKGVKTTKTEEFALNEWEEAEENLDLADENGKITLVKPDGKTVDKVDYNPYIHNRLNKVNSQFKQAWERPNLVYIETEVPVTDLESGYHAEKAAKPVGIHKWNGGDLMLSRYDKPVRIVPWEEVADDWVKRFAKRGVEFDIVPPVLRPILIERGVEILPPHKGMGEDCNNAYKEWKDEQGVKFRKKIADKEVENVVVDSSMTYLPTNRGEALVVVSKMEKPFINKEQGKEIKVSNKAIRHAATQDNSHEFVDVRCIGVIDRIIENAVKIGEIPVAEDEIGKTHLVEIY